MFCKNCGQELNDYAVICPHCGVATDKLNAPRVSNTMSAQSPYGAPPVSKTNGYAIAGFVLALIGMLGGNYFFCIPSILGLVFSIVGFVKVKHYNSGFGLGLAGIIIGAIGLFIWFIIWCMAWAIIFAMITGGYYPYY